MSIKVSACNIYPVKSLGGISLAYSAVAARGLQDDRLYKLVDETGCFITQRQHPRLAGIATAIDEKGLRLTARDGRTLTVTEKDLTAERIATVVWSSTCQSQLAAAPVNEWLSDVLEMPVRLVHMPDNETRKTDPAFSQPGDHVSFADGFPILVTSHGSLDMLQPHFSKAVGMDRFRANIELTGAPPFAEDMWHHIRIGAVELELVKPCSRCAVTTIDQETGEKPSADPLATLGKLRRGVKGLYFGENAIARRIGTIHVGDEVEILSARPLPDVLQPAKLNALHPSVS